MSQGVSYEKINTSQILFFYIHIKATVFVPDNYVVYL